MDQWSSSGKPDHSTPWTPYLDRIDNLCKKAGIPRSSYLELAKIYSARCEIAHKAPPKVDDFRIPDKDGSLLSGIIHVNWREMEKECERREMP